MNQYNMEGLMMKRLKKFGPILRVTWILGASITAALVWPERRVFVAAGLGLSVLRSRVLAVFLARRVYPRLAERLQRLAPETATRLIYKSSSAVSRYPRRKSFLDAGGGMLWQLWRKPHPVFLELQYQSWNGMIELRAGRKEYIVGCELGWKRYSLAPRPGHRDERIEYVVRETAAELESTLKSDVEEFLTMKPVLLAPSLP